MFSDDSHVVVQQLEGRGWDSWELRSPLTYEGQKEVFTVEPGFPTDFASVPRIFVWFLPRYGRYTRAAILHDRLWRMAKDGKMAWRDADAIFRRAMRELEVPFLRRWIMWAAVRWGALRKFRQGGASGWLKDAPAVVLLTLLAAPVVLPPAAVILAVLALFQVFEAVTWVLLYLGRGVKALLWRKRPGKALHRPSFEWKTA